MFKFTKQIPLILFFQIPKTKNKNPRHFVIPSLKNQINAYMPAITIDIEFLQNLQSSVRTVNLVDDR